MSAGGTYPLQHVRSKNYYLSETKVMHYMSVQCCLPWSVYLWTVVGFPVTDLFRLCKINSVSQAYMFKRRTLIQVLSLHKFFCFPKLGIQTGKLFDTNQTV